MRAPINLLKMWSPHLLEQQSVIAYHRILLALKTVVLSEVIVTFCKDASSAISFFSIIIFATSLASIIILSRCYLHLRFVDLLDASNMRGFVHWGFFNHLLELLLGIAVQSPSSSSPSSFRYSCWWCRYCLNSHGNTSITACSTWRTKIPAFRVLTALHFT